MLSETDKAYLAGMVDGEGTITLSYYRPKALGISLSIYNTNIGVMKDLQELWGGHLTISPARGRSKSGGRLGFGQNQAVVILKEIQPFLRMKKEQCRVALQFADTVSKHHAGGGKGVPPHLRELRTQLKEEMRVLNKRGVS